MLFTLYIIGANVLKASVFGAKAAGDDPSVSATAFCILNGGNSEKRHGFSNTVKAMTATLGKALKS